MKVYCSEGGAASPNSDRPQLCVCSGAVQSNKGDSRVTAADKYAANASTRHLSMHRGHEARAQAMGSARARWLSSPVDLVVGRSADEHAADVPSRGPASQLQELPRAGHRKTDPAVQVNGAPARAVGHKATPMGREKRRRSEGAGNRARAESQSREGQQESKRSLTSRRSGGIPRTARTRR